MTADDPRRGRARRPLRRAFTAVVAIAAVVSAGLTGFSLAAGPAAPASAAPGNPGTPSTSRVLYLEDFSNGSGVQSLTSYVGYNGTTYTADDYWASAKNCNGFILSYQDTKPNSTYCNADGKASESDSTQQFNLVRAKVSALGNLNSPADQTTNRGLSTNSNGPIPAVNGIEFATARQIILPSANGRFITFSVDAAATDCGEAHPLLRFYLKNAAGVETPVSSRAIDPCVDTGTSGNRTQFVTGLGLDSNDPVNTVHYGRFPANGSQLFSGSSVGVVLRNEQPADQGNDGAIDNIRILDVTPQLDKQFSPARVETGGTSTLTFTVTNTDDLASKNGWSFTDTLPSGLTIANPSNLGGTCTADKSATAGGTQLAVTNGQLAAGQASCTVTVQVTSSTTGTYSNGPGNVTEVGLDPPGTTTVTFTDPSYTVQKSASAATANPGTPITYSVQVKNTGEWAYDDNAPTGLRRASFSDDLSGVLDDATYNGDASDGATVSGNTLSWSGTLAVGETKTITYSVTPKTPGSGNLQLDNSVSPGSPGGSCVPGQCTTSTPVQALQITKTADQRTVIPGSKITYTITVKNTGKVDYTTGSNAASFSDDLTNVLDDANWNGDATATAGAVSYASPKLSWSGPVAAGDTVTVTYSVTVKNPDTGDSQIDNAVTSDVPGNNCKPNSGDPSCEANIPSSSYTVTKTASSTVANPGDTVTYTVTVTNTGKVAYTTDSPASFRDDLSAVLDDATYVAGSATNGAVVSGSTLSWQGPVAVGQSATVTYQVKVSDPDAGDHKLVNAVSPTSPGGRCATAGDCSTTTDVRSFTVEKSASTTTVVPGGTVTYTVTVKNTGTADYTSQVPASFSDDLTKVVDDATVNTPLPAGATLSADGKTLTWSGPLAVGATQQITYTVTVGNPDTGDKVLTNSVTPTVPGGDCATADGCTTTTPVKSFTVSKKASSATTTPGSRLTYTVTVVNTGGAAYTTDAPAAFSDDLSKVVDDATYNGDAVSSSDGSDPGVVTFTSPKLAWTGPLAVGATVTVTYTVTVNTPDTGDRILTNAVVPTEPGGECAPDAVCTTTTPVQSVSFTKVASTNEVVPGEVVSYTITVTNTGQVAYGADAPATFTDDMTNVLDDAAYDGNATATAGTVSYARPVLSWSGPVGIGETVTVTYSVTVNNPDTGDKVLDNAVVSTVRGSGCVADGTDPACRSVVPAGAYTVTKTASTSTATQGSTITYTVTVVNTGKTAYTDARPASFRDNLIQVLDDAAYNGDVQASGGAVAYDRPNLAWSGPLAIGGTVTVTYSVTVNTPDTGDRKVINAVVPTSPGGLCTVGGCTTTTSVPPGFSVHTGGDAVPLSGGAAGWMGLAGTGIAGIIACAAIWVRRRLLGH